VPQIATPSRSAADRLESVCTTTLDNVPESYFSSESLLLDKFEIQSLIDFFQILDRWDREGAHGTQTV